VGALRVVDVAAAQRAVMRSREASAVLIIPAVAEPDDLPCPYRGLFHFGPKDGEYFFGRDSFIEQLYQATQTRNFIPVLGASGSGKSSVVFAGLVPKLQAEESWQFTYFRPGTIRKHDKQEFADPFYALATALVPLYEPELKKTEQLAEGNKLADFLRSGKVLLSDVITRIQKNYPRDRILLIADQFEEIYTVCTDQKVRRQFLDILIDNIYPTSADSPLVLVLTMRADFLGDALSYASFAEVLNSDIKLGAMNHTELREVIEKPAQELGVTFAPGLVETILDDVEDEPGNLPLLEFALTELWQRRKGKQITHDAYQEIDKVQGALTRHADRVLTKLSSVQKQEARRIFIKLVNLGEGTGDTRRQVTQAEIGSFHWHFVKQLADDRLVVTSQNTNEQETVEVVHEALIRNWSQLREWIDESRDAIRTARKIEAEAKEWETKGKNKGYLLQDRRLRDAKEFMQSDHAEVEFSDLVKEFIQASREKEKSDRLKRIAIALVAPVTLTLVVANVSVISFADYIFSPETECNRDSLAKPLFKYLSFLNLLWFSLFEETTNLFVNKNFCQEDLSGIDLSNYQIKLDSANFSGAELQSVTFRQGTNFEKVDFENTDFNLADLEKAVFTNSTLDGAEMTNTNLTKAKFIDTKLTSTSFQGATLDGAIFIRSNLSYSINITEDIVNKINSGDIKICESELPLNIKVDPNRDCEDKTVIIWK